MTVRYVGFIYTPAAYSPGRSDFMGHQSHHRLTIDYKVHQLVSSTSGESRPITPPIPLTGNVDFDHVSVTTGDTPGQNATANLRYNYGWAGCADPNNRDGNNPYCLCTTTDEGGHHDSHSCVTPTTGLRALIIQMADRRRSPTTRPIFTDSAPIA